MLVREFVEGDAPRLCEIYYRSVHEVASKAYSREQIDAWAPSIPDAERWIPILSRYRTFVAQDDEGTISAWISMTTEGYIDMLFCIPEAIGKGFAASLYLTVEHEAIKSGIPRLSAHASLLAQPFFLRFGWIVESDELHLRNGVAIPRAEMSKMIDGSNERSIDQS